MHCPPKVQLFNDKRTLMMFDGEKWVPTPEDDDVIFIEPSPPEASQNPSEPDAVQSTTNLTVSKVIENVTDPQPTTLSTYIDLTKDLTDDLDPTTKTPNPSTSTMLHDDCNEKSSSVKSNTIDPKKFLKGVQLSEVVNNLLDIYSIYDILNSLIEQNGLGVIDGLMEIEEIEHYVKKLVNKETNDTHKEDEKNANQDEQEPPSDSPPKPRVKPKKKKPKISKEPKPASLKKPRKSKVNVGTSSPDVRLSLPQPVISIVGCQPSLLRIIKRRQSNPMKRKVDEIHFPPKDESTSSKAVKVASLKKRRMTIHDIVESRVTKDLRPVPPAMNIVDYYLPSELPPPLDVVPEPKDPEFKHKIFNKVKKRIAHNPMKKLDGSQDDKSKKPPNETMNKGKKSALKIPKKTRRESVTDEIPLLLLDDAPNDDDRRTDDESQSVATNDNMNEDQVDVRQDVLIVEPPEAQELGKDDQFVMRPIIGLLNRYKCLKELNNNDPPFPAFKTVQHYFAAQTVPSSIPTISLVDEETEPRSSNNEESVMNGIKSAVAKEILVPYDCRNILSDVLKWKVEWLRTKDPPIVDCNMMRTSNDFSSYGNYVK